MDTNTNPIRLPKLPGGSVSPVDATGAIAAWRKVWPHSSARFTSGERAGAVRYNRYTVNEHDRDLRQSVVFAVWHHRDGRSFLNDIAVDETDRAVFAHSVIPVGSPATGMTCSIILTEHGIVDAHEPAANAFTISAWHERSDRIRTRHVVSVHPLSGCQNIVQSSCHAVGEGTLTYIAHEDPEVSMPACAALRVPMQRKQAAMCDLIRGGATASQPHPSLGITKSTRDRHHIINESPAHPGAFETLHWSQERPGLFYSQGAKFRT
jgi:hypothetical protein